MRDPLTLRRRRAPIGSWRGGLSLSRRSLADMASFAPLPASVAWRIAGAADGYEVAFFDVGPSGVELRGATAAVEDGAPGPSGMTSNQSLGRESVCHKSFVLSGRNTRTGPRSPCTTTYFDLGLSSDLN
jgi:hypothetical protein